jgi:hypothetical protein
MRTLRVAAVLILSYAFLVLLNGIFYSWWSGDVTELPGMGIRVAGAGLISWGVWTITRWGWWFGVIFCGLLAVLGVVGLAAALASGLLESRPYPLVDLLFLVLSSGALAAAFLCMLLPGSRRALGSAGETAS